MQESICSSLQFSQRTDALASVLNCYLRDLPAKIGISERSMFGYRAGKYPVTAKALRKLQSAELAAGISEDNLQPPDQDIPAAEPPESLKETASAVMARMESIERNLAETTANLAKMSGLLADLMETLKKGPT